MMPSRKEDQFCINFKIYTATITTTELQDLKLLTKNEVWTLESEKDLLEAAEPNNRNLKDG